MQFAITTHAVTDLNCDLVVLFSNGDAFSPALEQLNRHSGDFFRAQQQRGNFPLKKGQNRLFLTVPNADNARYLLINHDGKARSLAKSVAAAVKIAREANWTQIVVALEAPDQLATAARAVVDADYCFDAYKSDANAERAELSVSFLLSAEQQSAGEAQLAHITAWARGNYLTRDLANTPANVCNPAYLGAKAHELAQEYADLSVQVLDLEEIKALKMGALLGVAQGSANEPRFIVFEYHPAGAQNEKPIVLVGKGVTFDSGGISLKPGAGMDEMKYDMGGAASVMGTLKAVCEAKLPVHLVGLIAAVENMPGGKAQRPGDIVTSLSGKTIEVLNTDAEGRLILCDALTYAERYEPEAVINMATLTGACVIALGGVRSGLMTNNQALADKLLRAGEEADDVAWQLPLDEEYKEMLHSPFADLPNISGGREAGAITAGAFLSAFTEKYPWAHLDVAGTAWKSGAQKGATGRPVGLLFQFLCDRVTA